METAFSELKDWEGALRALIRLTAAVIVGGFLGWEREREGKAAGTRTHMLVCLGSAVFAFASTEHGMGNEGISRVIQGVAAGIGFLGAGTILKHSDLSEIKGLTTAANIWLTAAVGIAVGIGQIWTAVSGVLLAWLVLGALPREKTKKKSASA